MTRFTYKSVLFQRCIHHRNECYCAGSNLYLYCCLDINVDILAAFDGAIFVRDCDVLEIILLPDRANYEVLIGREDSKGHCNH